MIETIEWFRDKQITHAQDHKNQDKETIDSIIMHANLVDAVDLNFSLFLSDMAIISLLPSNTSVPRPTLEISDGPLFIMHTSLLKIRKNDESDLIMLKKLFQSRAYSFFQSRGLRLQFYYPNETFFLRNMIYLLDTNGLHDVCTELCENTIRLIPQNILRPLTYPDFVYLSEAFDYLAKHKPNSKVAIDALIKLPKFRYSPSLILSFIFNPYYNLYQKELIPETSLEPFVHLVELSLYPGEHEILPNFNWQKLVTFFHNLNKDNLRNNGYKFLFHITRMRPLQTINKITPYLRPLFKDFIKKWFEKDTYPLNNCMLLATLSLHNIAYSLQYKHSNDKIKKVTFKDLGENTMYDEIITVYHPKNTKKFSKLEKVSNYIRALYTVNMELPLSTYNMILLTENMKKDFSLQFHFKNIIKEIYYLMVNFAYQIELNDYKNGAFIFHRFAEFVQSVVNKDILTELIEDTIDIIMWAIKKRALSKFFFTEFLDRAVESEIFLEFFVNQMLFNSLKYMDEITNPDLMVIEKINTLIGLTLKYSRKFPKNKISEFGVKLRLYQKSFIMSFGLNYKSVLFQKKILQMIDIYRITLHQLCPPEKIGPDQTRVIKPRKPYFEDLFNWARTSLVNLLVDNYTTEQTILNIISLSNAITTVFKSKDKELIRNAIESIYQICAKEQTTKLYDLETVSYWDVFNCFYRMIPEMEEYYALMLIDVIKIVQPIFLKPRYNMSFIPKKIKFESTGIPFEDMLNIIERKIEDSEEEVPFIFTFMINCFRSLEKYDFREVSNSVLMVLRLMINITKFDKAYEKSVFQFLYKVNTRYASKMAKRHDTEYFIILSHLIGPYQTQFNKCVVQLIKDFLNKCKQNGVNDSLMSDAISQCVTTNKFSYNSFPLVTLFTIVLKFFPQALHAEHISSFLNLSSSNNTMDIISIKSVDKFFNLYFNNCQQPEKIRFIEATVHKVHLYSLFYRRPILNAYDNAQTALPYNNIDQFVKIENTDKFYYKFCAAIRIGFRKEIVLSKEYINFICDLFTKKDSNKKFPEILSKNLIMLQSFLRAPYILKQIVALHHDFIDRAFFVILRGIGHRIIKNIVNPNEILTAYFQLYGKENRIERYIGSYLQFPNTDADCFFHVREKMFIVKRLAKNYPQKLPKDMPQKFFNAITFYSKQDEKYQQQHIQVFNIILNIVSYKETLERSKSFLVDANNKGIRQFIKIFVSLYNNKNIPIMQVTFKHFSKIVLEFPELTVNLLIKLNEYKILLKIVIEDDTHAYIKHIIEHMKEDERIAMRIIGDLKSCRKYHNESNFRYYVQKAFDFNLKAFTKNVLQDEAKLLMLYQLSHVYVKILKYSVNLKNIVTLTRVFILPDFAKSELYYKFIKSVFIRQSDKFVLDLLHYYFSTATINEPTRQQQQLKQQQLKLQQQQQLQLQQQQQLQLQQQQQQLQQQLQLQQQQQLHSQQILQHQQNPQHFRQQISQQQHQPNQQQLNQNPQQPQTQTHQPPPQEKPKTLVNNVVFQIIIGQSIKRLKTLSQEDIAQILNSLSSIKERDRINSALSVLKKLLKCNNPPEKAFALANLWLPTMFEDPQPHNIQMGYKIAFLLHKSKKLFPGISIQLASHILSYNHLTDPPYVDNSMKLFKLAQKDLDSDDSENLELFIQALNIFIHDKFSKVEDIEKIEKVLCSAPKFAQYLPFSVPVYAAKILQAQFTHRLKREELNPERTILSILHICDCIKPKNEELELFFAPCYNYLISSIRKRIPMKRFPNVLAKIYLEAGLDNFPNEWYDVASSMNLYHSSFIGPLACLLNRKIDEQVEDMSQFVFEVTKLMNEDTPVIFTKIFYDKLINNIFFISNRKSLPYLEELAKKNNKYVLFELMKIQVMDIDRSTILESLWTQPNPPFDVLIDVIESLPITYINDYLTLILKNVDNNKEGICLHLSKLLQLKCIRDEYKDQFMLKLIDKLDGFCHPQLYEVCKYLKLTVGKFALLIYYSCHSVFAHRLQSMTMLYYDLVLMNVPKRIKYFIEELPIWIWSNQYLLLTMLLLYPKDNDWISLVSFSNKLIKFSTDFACTLLTKYKEDIDIKYIYNYISQSFSVEKFVQDKPKFKYSKIIRALIKVNDFDIYSIADACKTLGHYGNIKSKVSVNAIPKHLMLPNKYHDIVYGIVYNDLNDREKAVISQMMLGNYYVAESIFPKGVRFEEKLIMKKARKIIAQNIEQPYGVVSYLPRLADVPPENIDMIKHIIRLEELESISFATRNKKLSLYNRFKFSGRQFLINEAKRKYKLDTNLEINEFFINTSLNRFITTDLPKTVICSGDIPKSTITLPISDLSLFDDIQGFTKNGLIEVKTSQIAVACKKIINLMKTSLQAAYQWAGILYELFIKSPTTMSISAVVEAYINLLNNTDVVLFMRCEASARILLLILIAKSNTQASITGPLLKLLEEIGERSTAVKDYDKIIADNFHYWPKELYHLKDWQPFIKAFPSVLKSSFLCSTMNAMVTKDPKIYNSDPSIALRALGQYFDELLSADLNVYYQQKMLEQLVIEAQKVDPNDIDKINLFELKAGPQKNELTKIVKELSKETLLKIPDFKTFYDAVANYDLENIPSLIDRILPSYYPYTVMKKRFLAKLKEANKYLPFQFPNRIRNIAPIYFLIILDYIKPISKNTFIISATTSSNSEAFFLVQHVNDSVNSLIYTSIQYILRNVLKYNYSTRARPIRGSNGHSFEVGLNYVMTFITQSFSLNDVYFNVTGENLTPDAIKSIDPNYSLMLKKHIVERSSNEVYVKLRTKYLESYSYSVVFRHLFSAPYQSPDRFFLSMNSSDVQFFPDNFNVSNTNNSFRLSPNLSEFFGPYKRGIMHMAMSSVADSFYNLIECLRACIEMAITSSIYGMDSIDITNLFKRRDNIERRIQFLVPPKDKVDGESNDNWVKNIRIFINEAEDSNKHPMVCIPWF